MLDQLLEFLKPREEKVSLGGVTFHVKEMNGTVNTEALADGIDTTWKILVRCVFKEDGVQAFSDEDIPRLKASSKPKLVPLVNAVNRVNGFLVEEEVKNSAAAQS
jgi:hypothetical protein